jgi:hypothetical protein
VRVPCQRPIGHPGDRRAALPDTPAVPDAITISDGEAYVGNSPSSLLAKT